MFVLRKIERETSREANIYLGGTYILIHKSNSKVYFDACLDEMEWMDRYDKENCYAAISDEGGRLIPLFAEYDNYIMTESGKTFARV